MADHADIYSETWKFIAKWAQAELSAARELNDSVKLTDSQTFVLRGRIKALKDLLALPTPPKERVRAPPDEEY